MYSNEVKKEYFRRRIDNPNLSLGQREYASFRYKQLNYGLYRLVDIQNDKMFVSDNPLGKHKYVVTDKLRENYRVNRLTHLYVLDAGKADDLRNGIIKKVKFDVYENPSGVSRYYVQRDKNNRSITESIFESNSDSYINFSEYRKLKAKRIIT